MLPADEARLDNPAYSALCDAHAHFAQVRGRVRRYQADVAPFLAMPSSPSPQDWEDASTLLGPGTVAAVRDSGAGLPDAWQEVAAFELVQMIEEQVRGVAWPDAVPLGAADVPEMLELVAETQPGPFLPRTIELGDYLGFRSEGALVAMAGERFRMDGWTEISAVCTSPDQRGRGLATRLVGALVESIHRRSHRVFLHVLSTNISAIGLYEALGFRVRHTARISVVTREAPPGTEP